jgi:hypothetical protein
MRCLKKEIWPHKVKVNEDQSSNSITEIEVWLGKQLGTFKGRWNVVYHYDKTYFYFREQQDAVLFALKWS